MLVLVHASTEAGPTPLPASSGTCASQASMRAMWQCMLATLYLLHTLFPVCFISVMALVLLVLLLFLLLLLLRLLLLRSRAPSPLAPLCALQTLCNGATTSSDTVGIKCSQSSCSCAKPTPAETSQHGLIMMHGATLSSWVFCDDHPLGDECRYTVQR